MGSGLIINDETDFYTRSFSLDSKFLIALTGSKVTVWKIGDNTFQLINVLKYHTTFLTLMGHSSSFEENLITPDNSNSVIFWKCDAMSDFVVAPKHSDHVASQW